MQYKKNKGEWSEFYVLLKILVDKILQGADEDLNLLSEPVYPVQKVIVSKDAPSQTDYTFSGELIEVKHPYSSDSAVAVVNTESLRPKVREVFEAIKGSQDTTFEIPETEDLIRDLKVESIQGSSSNKTDISIVLHDAVTQTQQEVGFSIKSQIGSPSTLLNASGATNFIYDTGLTGQEALVKINDH
jgi:type II restriction enzyme